MEENQNEEVLNNETEIVEDNGENIPVEGNDTIKIANDAVATYAGIAIAEVPGVYGMAGSFVGGITEALSGTKNLAKGIKVDVGEKDAKIDVNIIVEYGARIPDVAFEIQTRVKKTIESMTGLKVVEVNVHVQGVHMVSDKEEKNNEENQEQTNQEFNEQ